MDDFANKVQAAASLADALFVCWRYIADEKCLTQVFERSRGRCYSREISFPLIVQLVHDALTEHSGSGNQSFQHAAEQGTLTASTRAVYGKLGRMPVEVTVDLFSTMADRLLDLFPQKNGKSLPACFTSFKVRTVDGKTIKGIAKRLKPLRNSQEGLIGGKALVATDYQTGTAVGLAVDTDGDANDVRLLPCLLEDVRKRTQGQQLWVGDRQYCDLIQLGRFSENGDNYVVRYNAKNSFFRDENETIREGRDVNGRAYIDECGWLGADSNEHQRYVRRITLELDDGAELSIVTELFGVRKYPAADLLYLYGERWEIERVFQKVTEVFSLKNLIGGTPQAGLFQFAICLLLYNQLQLLRSYIAGHQDRETEMVSIEKLFKDVQRELIAWQILLSTFELETLIPMRNAEASQQYLHELLRTRWNDFWIKSTNSKKRKPQKREPKKRSKSVHKILNAKTD